MIYLSIHKGSFLPFRVLVEKSAALSDTPSSSLYMIPTVTTYIILHRQLFNNNMRIE